MSNAYTSRFKWGARGWDGYPESGALCGWAIEGISIQHYHRCCSGYSARVVAPDGASTLVTRANINGGRARAWAQLREAVRHEIARQRGDAVPGPRGQ